MISGSSSHGLGASLHELDCSGDVGGSLAGLVVPDDAASCRGDSFFSEGCRSLADVGEQDLFQEIALMLHDLEEEIKVWRERQAARELSAEGPDVGDFLSLSLDPKSDCGHVCIPAPLPVETACVRSSFSDDQFNTLEMRRLCVRAQRNLSLSRKRDRITVSTIERSTMVRDAFIADLTEDRSCFDSIRLFWRDRLVPSVRRAFHCSGGATD